MKNGIISVAVIRISRSGRGERRHGAGFGDAFFQNLPVLRFLVVKEHLGIVRLVELPLAGVNAELPEQRLHAERARFIRNDGDHALADLRVLEQQRQHADEGHGGGNFAALRAGQRLGQRLERRRRHFGGGRRARWACSRPRCGGARAGTPSRDYRPADGRTTRCAPLRPGWEFRSASGNARSPPRSVSSAGG